MLTSPRRVGSLLMVAAFTLGLSREAAAERIGFNGFGLNELVLASLEAGGTTHTLQVNAGELKFVWFDSTPAGFATSFYSYCIDFLAGSIPFPQHVTIRSSQGFTNGVVDGGAKAAWLVNTYAPTIHASGTGIQAAALQVAIWEAMHDTVNNLSGGSFQLWPSAARADYDEWPLSGAIASQANQYLSSLYYAPGQYYTDLAIVLDTNDGQDQITVNEPTTVLLLGFAGLMFLQRRRSFGSE